MSGHVEEKKASGKGGLIYNVRAQVPAAITAPWTNGRF
jgi:hypothetical protein